MSAEQKIWITRYLSEEGRLERLIKLYFKVRLSSIEAEDENSFWERFSDTLEERGLLPIGEDIPGNQPFDVLLEQQLKPILRDYDLVVLVAKRNGEVILYNKLSV
jgi:hypothetical protein